MSSLLKNFLVKIFLAKIYFVILVIIVYGYFVFGIGIVLHVSENKTWIWKKRFDILDLII